MCRNAICFSPNGFRRSECKSDVLLLNGTLSDFPQTAFELKSEFRADKCRAACSDKRSVTDLCGPIPRSGCE